MHLVVNHTCRHDVKISNSLTFSSHANLNFRNECFPSGCLTLTIFINSLKILFVSTSIQNNKTLVLFLLVKTQHFFSVKNIGT